MYTCDVYICLVLKKVLLTNLLDSETTCLPPSSLAEASIAHSDDVRSRAEARLSSTSGTLAIPLKLCAHRYNSVQKLLM